MQKEQVPFTLITLDDIPGRPPVAKIATDRTGSQWDEALNALKRKSDTHGIRVRASTKQERNRLKATLKTIAKNHGLFVKVLDHRTSTDFFAWISDEEGRFAGPRISN